MFYVKVVIVCALFFLVHSRPNVRPKVPRLLLSTDSSERIDDDYVEKLSDIFDQSIEKEHRTNLDNCENVICTAQYLCINDKIVTNGSELIEWRMAMVTIKKIGEKLVCDDMEMPCCADEAIKLDEIDYSTETDEEYDDEEDNQTFNVQKCGVRKQSTIGNRMIKRDFALPNEFPWMVGIFQRLSSSDKLRYIGGGSLIHESVILTAAHLLLKFQPEQLVIRAGEHDMLDRIPNKKRQEQFVSNIIIHEDLYAPSLINDIALIVLEKPFKLTETVNTICLPPQNIETIENTMCTTSGWGKNAANRHGKYQSIPKKIELPILGRRKCKNSLRKTRLGPFYNIDKSLMCAGGKEDNKDTSKGDGGSPLFCQIPFDNNRFYQTGIVAGGVAGGGNRIPGIYVKVAHFTNWISQQFQFIQIKMRPQNVLQYEMFD